MRRLCMLAVAVQLAFAPNVYGQVLDREVRRNETTQSGYHELRAENSGSAYQQRHEPKGRLPGFAQQSEEEQSAFPGPPSAIREGAIPDADSSGLESVLPPERHPAEQGDQFR